MRRAHSPNLIQFRASDALAAALIARASDEGVSVSEFLRTMVREKIGLGSHERPVNVLGPYELLHAAAIGSLEAQREMVSLALDQFLAGEWDDPTLLIAEALVFARLAAAQGSEFDAGMVLKLLSIGSTVHSRLGDEATAAELDGEAIARIAKMAGEGSDIADANLEAVVAGSSSRAVEHATALQERMKDARV